MVMKRTLIFLIIILLVGCATVPSGGAKIGQNDIRQVVILGEYASPEVANNYANQYNALVFYTKSRGSGSDAVSSGMSSIFGPSRSMKMIIQQLESISNTQGDWQFIIPEDREGYFLEVLKNMNDNSIYNCNGKVYLLSKKKNKKIEMELIRVTNGALEVDYKRYL
jgi:hypothetical protein